MRKLLSLLLALCAFAPLAMAQAQHGTMRFVGKSSFSVATVKVETECDTVKYLAAGQTSADITLPAMTYQMGTRTMTIPSFVIHGATFTMDMATMTAKFDNQTFSETVTDGGEEKLITGTSLVAEFKHNNFNSFVLTATFTYGSMPMPITYTIDGYYVKAYTDKMSVSIDKDYSVSSVTYDVRTYLDGETEKMDVAVPAYDLPDATIGALTSGAYTIRGLVFDASKGGYWRDYSGDGLTMHFHTARIDADYPLSATDANNILVTVDGRNITIVNKYKPGSMPFLITTTFPGENNEAGVNTVKATVGDNGDAMYNLSGQRVNASAAKGIMIKGGKKYVVK